MRLHYHFDGPNGEAQEKKRGGAEMHLGQCGPWREPLQTAGLRQELDGVLVQVARLS